MKIKQQKQIRAFLIEAFGNDRGDALFGAQDKMLGALIANTKNKSASQMKTLTQTILPRIALYKALLGDGIPEADAYAYVQKYMLEKVAVKKHKSVAGMEIVPGFYALYSKIYLRIMRKTDLQESTQSHDKKSYDVTITKCLWHTACVENGCAEMCRLFCAVDDVTYGGLRKIGFTRTKTLGNGDDCCDFHFFRK